MKKNFKSFTMENFNSLSEKGNQTPLGFYSLTKNVEGDDIVLQKMGLPQKKEGPFLPHSGSEYVSFEDINHPN